MESKTLIKRALRGDTLACDTFARRCLPMLYRYFTKTWKASQTEVDELIQDTFVAVWGSLHYLKSETFEPWVLTIARRIAWKYYKATPSFKRNIENKETENQDISLSCLQRSQEELVIAKDQFDQLLCIFDTLRTEYKEVLQLYYLEDFSVEELSQAMEIPLGTAKTWLQRARKELYQQWQKKNT